MEIIKKGIIDSINVVSDIASNQGSLASVGRWVSDLPSRISQIQDEFDDINEEDDKEDDKEGTYNNTFLVVIKK